MLACRKMEKLNLKDMLFETLPQIGAYLENPTRCPWCNSESIILSMWIGTYYGSCNKCSKLWREVWEDRKLSFVVETTNDWKLETQSCVGDQNSDCAT